MKKLKSYTRADAKVGDKIIIKGYYTSIATVEKLTPKQFVAGGKRFNSDGIEVISGYRRLCTFFYDEEFEQEFNRKVEANRLRSLFNKKNWGLCDDDLLFKIKNIIDEFE